MHAITLLTISSTFMTYARHGHFECKDLASSQLLVAEGD